MDIKKLILARIDKKKGIKTGELVAETGFSRAYLGRILQDLRNEGKIVRLGKAKGSIYVSAERRVVEEVKRNILSFKRKYTNDQLSEDSVLKDIQNETGLFGGLAENVENIVNYALLEMVNNAIEHSRSPIVSITMKRTDSDISFTVHDIGIGIFNNIRQKFGFSSNLEAIQQLLKGKHTTAPEDHTGQGIFFTSKMADSFIIESSGKRIRFLNTGGLNDVFLEDFKDGEGTTIFFIMKLTSQKTAQTIFQEFTDKDTFEFSKTRVLVRLFEFAENLLSRSEARRILLGLDKFSEIVLDFSGIKTVGQSFADEIFRVWQGAHQEIKISYQNAGENVEFMIKRALV